MRYNRIDVVFQEVPDEISLLFAIAGCHKRCKGCHSPELWDEENGQVLSSQIFRSHICKYKDDITCVCFFGGEWDKENLIYFLDIAKSLKLKTCLYTGSTDVSEDIRLRLDFLKVGEWNRNLGGLDSPFTNQKFYSLSDGRVLNSHFQSNFDQKDY